MMKSSRTLNRRLGQAALLLALATFGALAVAAAAGSESPFDVQASLSHLCQNKATEELVRISQVRALVKAASELAAGSCPEAVLESLSDLKPLLDRQLDNAPCTGDKIDQLRAYHLKHVASKGPMSRQLRNFVLALGLQVSRSCKVNMANYLIQDAQSYLTDRDRQFMASWTAREDGPLGQLLGNPSEHDDLLLMGEIGRIMGLQSGSQDKLVIQMATGKLVGQLQLVCERRLRPLYERLIMPLVMLSNLGYNYQGEDLQRELEELRANGEIHQWYRMVYLCESLRAIKIVEAEEDREATEGTDQRLVRILGTTEEPEAAAKEPRAGPAAGADQSWPQPLNYKLEREDPIGDVVLAESDRNMVKLVKNFNLKSSEDERVRWKALKKMATMARDSLLGGKLKLAGSLSGLLDQGPGSGLGAKEDMVRAIDSHVQQLNSEASGERSVAGALDWVKRGYHNAYYQGPKGVVHNLGKSTVKKDNPGRIFWRIMGGLFVIIVIVICAVG